MRVAVTGGEGFIGTQACRVLREEGHDVTVVDLTAAPSRDVRERADLDAVLPGHDVVLHLAARVGVEQGMADAPGYTDHTVLGTAQLLAAMAAHAVPRLVLASSMVVYGEGLGRCAEHGLVRPGSRRPADLADGRFEPPCPDCGRELSPALVGEDAATDPRSVYAVTKCAQEGLAGVWARVTGATAVALRFHNVYGPGLPLDTPYAGVAAVFRSAVRQGRAPRVTEDGGQRRDFVHVRDVARACAAAVSGGATAPGRLHAFNVGSGTPRTVLDLATAMTRAAGVAPPVVTGQARLADVRHVTASSALAAEVLGWSATEDFAAGVAEVVGLSRTPAG